jgi:hypothetical protein
MTDRPDHRENPRGPASRRQRLHHADLDGPGPASAPLVDEEAAAAAAEAGRIGGRPTRDEEVDLDHDPAMEPVYEAGGGEAEGFEMAEEELRENAEQGPATPGVGVRAVREETDRETEVPDPAVYGEADEEDVTEVTRDPAEGRDDPGAGPGLTSER